MQCQRVLCGAVRSDLAECSSAALFSGMQVPRSSLPLVSFIIFTGRNRMPGPLSRICAQDRGAYRETGRDGRRKEGVWGGDAALPWPW